ncbi:uncharacterized protein EKO05_0008189 [Ascochyta rabiei]|uniref:Uncharacterized protein n=1 Tax=Didymella rabiei TaxID=5454 RepID=A0A163DHC9_DIDRA|nr:uncharacterized protein EKO05_0008189 [Ascochyta rabiei]KZM23154.1 hypothetical protein ST47_g5842 [Ascochyta rabiei]UPX17862.1 hypothetical protein EKO05_0008189 [Ascochyta rabiei]
MATLAAHDQENAVRNLQIGPSGKPLNAGVKGFGAKTPGNKAPKTPYKIPLNDENIFTKGGDGKGKGKGNENLFLTTRKGGKLDASAFVTPAGPRNRAPLGAKTTNARGKAIQTPAPLGSSAKTLKASPRLRRPKVKVHQPEAEADSEDDVPEIEYMPPKEVPLPDDMDDYLPRDWDFSILGGENASRGITSAYHNPVEDDGRTRGQREFEESLERDRKKRDDEFDRIFEAQMAKDDAESRRYFGIKEPKKEAPKPTAKAASSVRPATGLSTMRARSAAAALAPIDRSTPRFGASTTAAKSRVPTGLISGRKTPMPLAEPTVARHARHASAVASSKGTIGYAQGRAVRSGSAMRPPLSNVTKPVGPSLSTSKRAGTMTPSLSSAHQRTVSAAASSKSRPFSRSSSTSTNATLVAPLHADQFEETAESVERELELLALQDEEGEEVDAWMNSFNDQLGGIDPLDEELGDFQLQLPEGL